MEEQIITRILIEAEAKDLDTRDIIGKLIARILDYRAGTTGSNCHRYYIDDQGRLFISYPSGFYAMDRQVTEDGMMRLLRGLSGDSSAEEISESIANSYAV